MSKNSRRQKQANKTAYSHKLYKFLRDLNSFNGSSKMDYLQFRRNLYKQYGFTEKDWHKAIHQTMSISEKDCFCNGIGLKKEVQNNRERVTKKLERELHSGKQDYLNEKGEHEIEYENDLILDVFDNYYDEEDMQR